jgi:phosphoglycolate phosphatase
MRYRAVLFDLDGTLLDTLEDIADSVNIVLSRSGLPEHDIESYRYFIGEGIEELAMRALPEDMQDEATINEYVAAIREEYGGRWANKTRPYQGIPELLDTLTARGIKMAILSNKPDNLTGITVSSLLSDWRFECVIGAAPAVPIKPDPSMALEIARRLDIPPGEFIYLGDGDTDMKTAVAAGMYPVGALWGFRTAAELTASGASKLIDKPADLLELL